MNRPDTPSMAESASIEASAVESPAAVAAEALASTASATSVATSSMSRRWADYKQLTKPSITKMVVITAAIGFALAVFDGAAWTWLSVLGTLVGTGSSCMAASVFNQVWERRADALMPRTANRPVAAGRVAPGEAIWLGVVLATLGQGLVCVSGNPLASAICGLTILSYVLVYTPMKRVTTWALWVGAIPGALPPVIGYTAAAGHVGAAAWAVFALMFVWQVPHFLAIAWMYRDDYAAGGMVMLSVIDPTGRRTARQAIATCVLLLGVSALPVTLGFAGWVYAGVAAAAGGWFLWTAIGFARRIERGTARRMFFASLIYLPVVLTALLLDAQ